ncbi:MAG: transcription regulator [Planctomycetaceae bacterium]|nr:transcription regulator [Planctomycetaceae bacterium]
MNVKSRIPDAGTDELPRELIELGKRLSLLPPAAQGELPQLYNQVVESVRRRRRILTLVQEALSQLRLDIKYLMFDLEVTRRERDALRGRAESDEYLE